MTKQGNPNSRTPQNKKQSDSTSKQASGSANLVFPSTESPLGTTQPATVATNVRNLQRTTFTTPLPTAPEITIDRPPPAPPRNRGVNSELTNIALEGVASEVAPGDFVSQNYEALAALMREEARKRSSQSIQSRLNFDPEDEASPSRSRRDMRDRNNHRHPIFTRIGDRVLEDHDINPQD